MIGNYARAAGGVSNNQQPILLQKKKKKKKKLMVGPLRGGGVKAGPLRKNNFF